MTGNSEAGDDDLFLDDRSEQFGTTGRSAAYKMTPESCATGETIYDSGKGPSSTNAQDTQGEPTHHDSFPPYHTDTHKENVLA